MSKLQPALGYNMIEAPISMMIKLRLALGSKLKEGTHLLLQPFMDLFKKNQTGSTITLNSYFSMNLSELEIIVTIVTTCTHFTIINTCTHCHCKHCHNLQTLSLQSLPQFFIAIITTNYHINYCHWLSYCCPYSSPTSSLIWSHKLLIKIFSQHISKTTTTYS